MTCEAVSGNGKDELFVVRSFSIPTSGAFCLKQKQQYKNFKVILK